MSNTERKVNFEAIDVKSNINSAKEVLNLYYVFLIGSIFCIGLEAANNSSVNSDLSQQDILFDLGLIGFAVSAPRIGKIRHKIKELKRLKVEEESFYRSLFRRHTNLDPQSSILNPES